MSDAFETQRLILHPTETDIVLPSCDDDDDEMEHGMDNDSFFISTVSVL